MGGRIFSSGNVRPGVYQIFPDWWGKFLLRVMYAPQVSKFWQFPRFQAHNQTERSFQELEIHKLTDEYSKNLNKTIV